MDHHCPWTGKCIGQGNLKCFQFFLSWTCVTLVYLMVYFMYWNTED